MSKLKKKESKEEEYTHSHTNAYIHTHLLECTHCDIKHSPLLSLPFPSMPFHMEQKSGKFFKNNTQIKTTFLKIKKKQTKRSSIKDNYGQRLAKKDTHTQKTQQTNKTHTHKKNISKNSKNIFDINKQMICIHINPCTTLGNKS